MSANNAVITTRILDRGVQASVSDCTSHYFGGYYHVRILITADVPVFSAAFADQDEFQNALRVLGDTVVFRRTLEKMAVPEQQIDEVRRHLLDSFEKTMLPYLQRDGFCNGLLQSEYRTAQKPARKPRYG